MDSEITPNIGIMIRTALEQYDKQFLKHKVGSLARHYYVIALDRTPLLINRKPVVETEEYFVYKIPKKGVIVCSKREYEFLAVVQFRGQGRKPRHNIEDYLVIDHFYKCF